MLPKVNKNLFQAKAKQVKSKAFSFKTFLVGVLFAGSTAMASSGSAIPTAVEMDNLIKQQKEVAFTLKPSLTGLTTVAGHYSHSSHSSHSSHRSHYSSSY